MRRVCLLFALAMTLAACGRGDGGPAPVTRGDHGRAGSAGVVQPVGGPGLHTVRRGQTLSEIAQRYGVDMDAMAAVNDLSPPYVLQIGQRLRIPRPRTYEVQHGDTVYGIARRFRVPIRAVIETNDLSPPYRLRVDQVLRIPQPRRYQVARGDTLYSISRRYDVAMSELARLNGLSPPYTITPGQDLLIPGGRTQVASADPGRRETDGSGGAEAGGRDDGGSAADGQGDGAASGTDATDTASQDTGATTTTQTARADEAGDTATDDGGASPPVAVPRPEPKPAVIKRADAGDTAAPGDDRDGGESTQTASRREDVPDPPARESGRFAWPLRGDIVTGYGPQDNGLHNDGLNIAAKRGTPVKAAANGVVAYVGNELQGFGNLILVKHADNWITAYAHLQTILVERGQQVSRGEPIGRVGSSGGVPKPQLHFETRRGSDAVNPNEVLGPATAGRVERDRRAARGIPTAG
jgi:murein DD-endopeptidase MepM/ murein hydrolase activator NlpD